MNQTTYEPRKGTLLAALQNAPGARISIGGRMVPVVEVLAERQAAEARAEAEKRAFAEARANAARRQAETDAANGARVQAEADARRADQAIVDAANLAVGAKYDRDTIVIKTRMDKQIGQSGRVMRVYWRRGDAEDLNLAPRHIQESISGCTSEQAAAEIVARRVIGNGFKVRAFYHDNGLRELVATR